MFSECTTYEKQLKIEKTRLSHQVWSHVVSTFKKKRTLNGHFSRPAETDPYVVKTEEAKSWPSLLKNATWILWSLGGGIIDLQGMEEVATEQGGQGISRHALCTDSHLAAPLENGLHLLAYNVAHTLAHILEHTLAHTHSTYMW